MLARDLGMTVQDLRRRMSPGEFLNWQALYVAEARERKAAEKNA